MSDHSPVALFLVDILNDFDFSDAGESLKKASTLAEKTAAPERRCRKVGIPAIYANDNRGKWRSDASDLVKECLNDDAPGRPLVEPLVPLRNDETTIVQGKVRYAVVGLGHIAQVAVLPAFKHAKRNSILVSIVTDDD